MNGTRGSPLLLVGSLWMLLLTPGCVVEIVDPDVTVDGGDEEATRDYQHVVFLNNQSSLRLLGANGGVRIQGVEGARQVTIHANLRVRSNTRSDALEHLGRLRVDVEKAGGRVLIRTVQPKHADGRSYSVDYEVTMPASLALEVVNGNGPVQVKDIRAAGAVESGNGDVDLSGLHGSLEVTVGNGSVVGSTFLRVSTSPPGWGMGASA